MPCAVRRRSLLPLLLSAAALAACSSDGADQSEGPAASPTAERPSEAAGPATDAPVSTVELTIGGGVLDVDVLPLVRVPARAGAPALVALTLDLSVAEPASDGDPLSFVSTFADLRRGGLGEAGALRLLDLGSDRVHLIGADADGKGVATDGRAWRDVEPGGTARVQVFYAAPPDDVEAVSLLVPGASLVDEVPVVDGEVPPASASRPGVPASTDLTLDPARVATAGVLPLEVFTTELDGAVRTLDAEEVARVDLAADVLFAVDAADLAPPSQAALQAAASAVRAREPGPVVVVGHTDDQGAPEYNLDLSRRRAQAVAAALGPLLGPEYPLDVQAKGETQPVAQGTDEQSRALNRRVTLAVSTPVRGEDQPVEGTGALPPAPELTASGDVGVLVDLAPTRPYRVRVPSVRLVQDHVVADVQITAEDDEVASAFGPGGLLGGTVDPRGEFSVEQTSTARSVVLLQGSTAVYSLDHVLDPADPTTRLCACDPDTNGRLDGGQTTTSTVVFPEVPVSGTVTLQVGDRGARSFRLTDVPVR